jgi:hypothetical protein
MLHVLPRPCGDDPTRAWAHVASGVPLRGLDSLRARARRSTICLVTKTYRPEINGAAITLGRWCGGLRQRGHVVPIVRPRRLPADSAGPSQDPLIMLMPAAPVLGYPGSGSAGRSCVCPSRRQVPGLEDRDSFSFVSAKGPSVTDSFPFRYLTGGGAPGALERLPAVEVTALAKFVAVGEARVHQRVALAFRQRFPALLVEVPEASEFHRVPGGSQSVWGTITAGSPTSRCLAPRPSHLPGPGTAGPRPRAGRVASGSPQPPR